MVTLSHGITCVFVCGSHRVIEESGINEWTPKTAVFTENYRNLTPNYPTLVFYSASTRSAQIAADARNRLRETDKSSVATAVFTAASSILFSLSLLLSWVSHGLTVLKSSWPQRLNSWTRRLVGRTYIVVWRFIRDWGRSRTIKYCNSVTSLVRVL